MPSRSIQETKDTARLEAFSDGVFAIAVTLLVLNLKVPDHDTSPNLDFALSHMSEAYLGFVISFMTILIMWINHHRMFKLIRRTDEWLLLSNGLLLFLVTFVPFPTAVLTNWYHTSQSTTAAVFYSASLVALAVSFNVLWWTISYKHRLVDHEMDGQRIAAITRQYALGPALYLVAVGLAFASVPACIGFNLLLALFFCIPGLALKRSRS